MKYIKFYLRTFKICLMEQMSFRENFFIWSFVHIATLIVNIIFFRIVFSGLPTLNGWSENESLLVLGISSFISGVGSFTFFPFMYSLSGLIKTGEFDFILIRPMNALFQSAFDWVDMEDLIIIPSALGLIIYSMSNLENVPSLINIIFMFLMIINSLIFIFSFITFVQSFAFKSVEVKSASGFIWNIISASKYPIKSFKKVPVTVGFALVPIAFITNVPAEIAIGRVDLRWVFGALLTSISLFLFSRWLFFRRLRHYSSASS